MPQGILDDLALKLDIPQKLTLPGSEVKVDLRHVDKTAEKVLGSATDIVIQTGVAFAVVIGGWYLSSWLASATQRLLIRARLEETVAAFIGSLARYTLFLTCVVAAFDIMGVSLTSMMAIFGAVGLAVAFALRNTLTHVAAGLMLIINRPFKVGDFVEIEAVMGTVKRITLFNTEINTLQNQRLFVPNSRLWDNILKNHTYNEVRSVELTVSFSYEDDPRICKELLKDVFSSDSNILKKPEPYVETTRFDESAIVYLFRFWVKTREFGLVRQQILDEIWHAAAKKGLTMPYPQRVVHPAPPPSRKPKATGGHSRLSSRSKISTKKPTPTKNKPEIA